jgi:prepilin-type N-terminal cleavage/methylation domain-containing protein
MMSCFLTKRWIGLRAGGERAPGGSRRGFTLVEMTAATAVLTIGLALTAQVVTWVAAERRVAARRQWALHEADNVLERVTVRSWDTLTSESVQDPALAERVRAELPDGRVSIDVAADSADSSAKRVRVEIRWRSKAGVDDAPVQLTAWVHKRGPNP